MAKPVSEQDLLSVLVAGKPDSAIFLVGPDGRVLTWNAGARNLSGFSAEEMIGQPVSLLYPAADHQMGKLDADFAHARRHGRLRQDGWRVRKDGSEFLADFTVQTLRDDDGELRGYGVVFYDITGRKAAEDALARSEQHLRSILATIPDAMIVIDERGIIISFSAAAEKLFGYAESEVAGRNVSMLMPSPDRERHDDYIRHYCETGERRIIGIGRIVVGCRRDGSEFPMELSVGETRTNGHRIFTGFVRDLTEQKQRELRLKELQSELVHVSRVSAMGTMASTLAHELNQPLTAIANYMEAGRDLLETGNAAPDLLREAMTESANEALRAGEIVRRLRDFVARGEVEKKVENLAHLVDEASRLALAGASERGIRTFFAISPDTSSVLGDRIQIQQVLVNLIRNAADAVTNAAIREIRIASVPSGDDMVRISVADTGPGIAPEIAPQLFQAFASTKQDGMGLGLSICRTIVEAHGGRIWAEPRADGGTIMFFTLPDGETHE